MEPSHPPLMKVSFNVTISENRSCIVVVARNHKIEVIFRCTELILDQNPLRAKAKAAKLAVVKAAELGFKHVICEGNILNVILPL